MPSSLVAYPSEDAPLLSWARYSMMNLPFAFTTAGLNVPADSKPIPCGDSSGSKDSRLQGLKGGAKTSPRAVKAKSRIAHKGAEPGKDSRVLLMMPYRPVRASPPVLVPARSVGDLQPELNRCAVRWLR